MVCPWESGACSQDRTGERREGRMRRRASTFPDRAWAEPPSHLRAYSSSGEKLEDDDSRSWLPVWMPLFHKFASGALRYSKEGCRVVGGGEGRAQAA